MKNENVLYIERKKLESVVDLSLETIPMSESLVNTLSYGFVSRCSAETDVSKKQLIPYLLLLDSENRILTYRRNGSEKRLSQKFSAGIGGHVNDNDKGATLWDILLCGLSREVYEEIGLILDKKNLRLLGLINEEKTDVGHVHTGIVFALNVNPSLLKFDAEIAEPQWLNLMEIPFERAELWTALALKLLNQSR